MSIDFSSESTTIPALQPGDMMRRDEFERRYMAMSGCKKAELINGVVYMPSPARLSHHAEPHSHLNMWLAFYSASTPGVRVADNATNRLDMDNEPQPDCMLFIDPDVGGQVRISDDDYVTGPPEFIAEISSSSLALDRGPKAQLFLLHGVKEYLIWRVDDRMFEWNVLRGSRYDKLPMNTDGQIRSETFPGLWLNVKSMLDGDLAAVLETLQLGLASQSHQEFVQTLQRK